MPRQRLPPRRRRCGDAVVILLCAVAGQDFPKPRFGLDADLRYLVASAYLTVKGHIDDPAEPPRPAYLAAAATLGYALGLSLPEVRNYGRRGLLAFRQILKQRPPLEAFQKPVGPGSWLDYSIGSSSESLRYMYWALLLREHELAREIAADTWDPPHMGRTRIFPEYRVAYGLGIESRSARGGCFSAGAPSRFGEQVLSPASARDSGAGPRAARRRGARHRRAVQRDPQGDVPRIPPAREDPPRCRAPAWRATRSSTADHARGASA